MRNLRLLPIGLFSETNKIIEKPLGEHSRCERKKPLPMPPLVFQILSLFHLLLIACLIYFRIWVPLSLYRPSTEELAVQWIGAVLDNDRERAIGLSDGSAACWSHIRYAFDTVHPLVQDFEGEITWGETRGNSRTSISILFIPDTPAQYFPPDSVRVKLRLIENKDDLRRYVCGSLESDITTYEENVRVGGEKLANSIFNLVKKIASRKYVKATPQN